MTRYTPEYGLPAPELTSPVVTSDDIWKLALKTAEVLGVAVQDLPGGLYYRRALTVSDTLEGLLPGAYDLGSVDVARALGLPEDRYGVVVISGPPSGIRTALYTSTEIDRAANPSRSWSKATDNAGSFGGRVWRELTGRTRGVPGNYATDVWATRPGYNGIWAVSVAGVTAAGSHSPTNFSYNLDHETQPNGGSHQQAFATHEGDEGAYWRGETAAGSGQFTPWKRFMDERMSPALNRHELLYQEMAAAHGGRIFTGDAVPVALTWDDYPRDFRDRIMPLLAARGLPCTIGLSSKMYEETSTVIQPGAVGTTFAEINAWPSWISIANHSATHRPAEDRYNMYWQIVTGLKDLQSALPNKPIYTWMQPAVAYDAGFNNGNSLESYAGTIAGHLQLGHHAYVTGLRRVGTDTTCPMVGNRPIQGLVRNWLDSKTGIDAAKIRINGARAKKHGLILAGHADRYDLPGMSTMAELITFLDWLKAEQDAGRVRVMKLEEFAIAQYGAPGPIVSNTVGRTVSVWDHENQRMQLIGGDTGRRNIVSTFATMTEGKASLRRVGQAVTLAIDAARFSNQGTFTLAGVIPEGFRPDETFNDFAVQLGGTDGWRVAISTAGNFSSYNYSGGWFRCYLTWMTNQPWPASLPGTAIGVIPHQ